MDSRNKCITDSDVENFVCSQGFDGEKSIVVESDLGAYSSLESLFGERWFTVLFRDFGNPGIEIGHWTLLIEIDDETVEYFDSAALDPPEDLVRLCEGKKIRCLKKRLQDPKSFVCGKYVIMRMISAGTSLKMFEFMLRNVGNLTPDDVVDRLVTIKYK